MALHPSIESNPVDDPDREINKLAKQIQGDLNHIADYSVYVKDGCIVISLKGSDDLKIRPISDMVNHFSDIKIAEYISKDFSNFSKVFDFGDLLESSIVNPNSLAGMEMIYLKTVLFLLQPSRYRIYN